MELQSPQERKRTIGWIGTIARVVGGLGGLYWGAMHGLPRTELVWLDLVLGLAAYPAGSFLVMALRLRLTRESMRAYGVLGHGINLGIGMALFSVTPHAAALFYGPALLLQAARGHAGCEILAVSNFLLRRDDQVGCAVYTPLDAVEARLTNRLTQRAPAQ